MGWARPLIASARRYEGTRLGAPLSTKVGVGVRDKVGDKRDCKASDDTRKRFLLADRGARIQEIADWLEPRIAQELLFGYISRLLEVIFLTGIKGILANPTTKKQ